MIRRTIGKQRRHVARYVLTTSTAVFTLGLVALSGCARRERPNPARPVPSRSVTPDVSIGIASTVESVEVEAVSSAELQAVDPSIAIQLSANTRLRITPGPDSSCALSAGVSGAEKWSLELSEPFRVVAKDSTSPLLRLNGRAYPGVLRFVTVAGTLQVENQVDLETYLRGVVPVELGFLSRATPAALRVQAVISRTYALRKIASADSILDSTIGDQVYAGADVWAAAADDAIRDTHGMIVAYDGRPALTLFHSTCGGHTSPLDAIWPRYSRPISYLQGVSDLDETATPYCFWSKYAHWREHWSIAELRATLQQYLPSEFPGIDDQLRGPSGPIDIRITGRTPDGRVTHAQIRAWGHEFDLHGERIRWVLRPPGKSLLLRSSKLTRVEIGVDGLDVEGEGWGHGLGLCQVGAIERAARGSDWEQILNHYYPGTYVMQAY